MPATSTVPAAKAALIVAFAAQSELADVTITWGGPTEESDMTDEMVYLGDVEQTEEDRTFTTTDEDYTIEVVALVRSYGDDEQATEERLWDIREALVEAVKADDTLGGLLVGTGARVERTRQDNQPLTDGWYARARLDVRCRSVLTD